MHCPVRVYPGPGPPDDLCLVPLEADWECGPLKLLRSGRCCFRTGGSEDATGHPIMSGATCVMVCDLENVVSRKGSHHLALWAEVLTAGRALLPLLAVARGRSPEHHSWVRIRVCLCACLWEPSSED